MMFHDNITIPQIKVRLEI